MFQLAEEMDEPDPYQMAERMGNSLLAEWRAYFKIKHEQQMQDQAASRAEAGNNRPRGR